MVYMISYINAIYVPMGRGAVLPSPKLAVFLPVKERFGGLLLNICTSTNSDIVAVYRPSEAVTMISLVPGSSSSFTATYVYLKELRTFYKR